MQGPVQTEIGAMAEAYGRAFSLLNYIAAGTVLRKNSNCGVWPE